MELIKETPQKEINTVSEFIDYVMKWKKRGVKPTSFRGQSFYGWFTKPKIFRNDVNITDHEDSAVRDIVSLHPHDFVSDNTMFDRLVRMQHYGLPTRLLDVTTNPLVALWFSTELYNFNDESEEIEKGEKGGRVTAFFAPQERQKYYDSDTVSCLSNLANLKKQHRDEILDLALKIDDIEEFNRCSTLDYLFSHIRMEKSHFIKKVNPKDLIFPLYVKPKLSNKRIIAQSGAFMLFATENYSPKESAAPIMAEHVYIPPSSKEAIRKELEVLGIHESTLFPEIEKAAKFITMRYQNSLGANADTLI